MKIVRHHEVLGVHHRAVEVHELLDEVLVATPEELHEVPGQGGEHGGTNLGWIPPGRSGHEVPHLHLVLGGPHGIRSRHDGLEDLDLVGAVVLVLILIPPETDVNLPVLRDLFGQHPPPMAVLDHIGEGRVVGQEGPEVSCWT